MKDHRATKKPPLPARKIVAVALLAALVGVLAFQVASGRWQIRPILSGSMRPGFPVGGVVVTQREPLADLQINDVIITHPPGQPHFNLIHRVIQIKSIDAHSAVVQTKGDDNPAPDPFTIRVKGPWIYQARFTVPLVGYAALDLHSPTGRRALLVIAVLLLILVGIRTLVGRLGAGRTAERHDDEHPEPPTTGEDRGDDTALDPANGPDRDGACMCRTLVSTGAGRLAVLDGHRRKAKEAEGVAVE